MSGYAKGITAYNEARARGLSHDGALSLVNEHEQDIGSIEDVSSYVSLIISEDSDTRFERETSGRSYDPVAAGKQMASEAKARNPTAFE